MLGQGLLLILTDVEPNAEAEFNGWYDTEHMGERVTVPGFIAARRYRSENGARRYLALYETESIAVFESEVYRQALKRQSDWSRRMLAHFVDPHRAVGKITASRTIGIGGALALFKLPSVDSRAIHSELAGGALPKVAGLSDIFAVHLFQPDPRLSGPVAEYPPSKRTLAGADEPLLIVEGAEAAALIPERLEPLAALESLGIYKLTFALSKRHVG
jgi:hypothetical protein